MHVHMVALESVLAGLSLRMAQPYLGEKVMKRLPIDPALGSAGSCKE